MRNPWFRARFPYTHAYKGTNFPQPNGHKQIPANASKSVSPFILLLPGEIKNIFPLIAYSYLFAHDDKSPVFTPKNACRFNGYFPGIQPIAEERRFSFAPGACWRTAATIRH